MPVPDAKSSLSPTFLKHSLRAICLMAGFATLCAASAWAIFPRQDAPARPVPLAGVLTGVTTVVIVRHAEKADDDPRDPSLSTVGQTRAAALAVALDGAEVGAIYSTPFKRTRATVEPLAKRFNIPVTARPIRGEVSTYAAQLARDVIAKDAGKTVVIVGHSNTVPELVKAFSGRAIPALSDEDYDQLHIVVLPANGPARLIQTRFGAPHSAPSH